MKINDTTGKLPPAAQISERTAPAATSGAGPAARVQAEQVSLSGPARALMASNDEAPMDSVKVAEIREKIAAGNYRIDSAKIADSLISAARDLIARRH